METKHTQGEWRAVKRERIGFAEWAIAWSDIDELVCDIVYTEADARLMAASKELLSALKETLDLICRECADGHYTAQAHMAREAIAKASGSAA